MTKYVDCLSKSWLERKPTLVVDLIQKFVNFLISILSDRVLFAAYRAIRFNKRIYLLTRTTKLVGRGT